MDLMHPIGDVHWQAFEISKDDRRKMKGHSSAIVWLTGLPASGKTTIARQLEKDLHEKGCHTYILDGDNVRHGLNKDLGFSKEARKENIRRIAEVAKLFLDGGLIVICAFVSPYKDDRVMARRLVEESEFIEVYVKCPVDICMQRDPKSMYKKAVSGKMTAFTGVDDPYEEPDIPELVLETDRLTIREGTDRIVGYLEDNGKICKNHDTL
jgi:adenylyl-sulfate kinase